ncbi:hypothetical protein RCO48_32010 [Peribacillus frigoritolerans]|nr:hypothetical protein [Peribacillus frigoritolerans]
MKELQNRLDFINLKSQPLDLIGIISNDEVVEIIYEFIKVRIQILDLGKIFESDSEEVQKNSKKDTGNQKRDKEKYE